MFANSFFFFFFFNDPATTEIYTLSLHDALPICSIQNVEEAIAIRLQHQLARLALPHRVGRSEEHTSELQSPCNLVCRLLLEKKKKKRHPQIPPIVRYRDTIHGRPIWQL